MYFQNEQQKYKKNEPNPTQPKNEFKNVEKYEVLNPYNTQFVILEGKLLTHCSKMLRV